MDKFHNNSSYVDLIIQDAVAHKRFKADRLDKSMTWYWGVDEESFEMMRKVTNQTEASHTSTVDEATAEAMFSDGGIFGDGVIDMDGLDCKMLTDFGGQKAATGKKGGKATPKPKTGKPKDGTNAGGQPPASMEPEEPWKAAAQQMQQLASAKGKN
eukprot:252685-Alexandrium_andersonii.AAC.1